MDKIEIFQETDRSKKSGKLYIVVPCYNEEEALETSAIIKEKIGRSDFKENDIC